MKALTHFVFPQPNYQLIGHRGVAGIRPENTLVSFMHAKEIGLNWIEFDIRLTKDNHWIILHDETLDRTTTGTGAVYQFEKADLASLEAGLWFSPPYPGQSIPSLEQVLELSYQLDLYLNIEVKGANNHPEHYVNTLIQFLDKHLSKHYTKPLVSSFDLLFLIRLRQKSPTLPIGYLIESFGSDTFDIFEENQFTTIHCSQNTFKESDLVNCQSRNIPVLLYTVNDPAIAKCWLTKGVTAVFSDRPDILKKELATKLG